MAGNADWSTVQALVVQAIADAEAGHLEATATNGWVADEDLQEDEDGLFWTGWSDFWSSEDAMNDWLVEPFLAEGRGTALYSAAKAGKSLLSLEVAAAIATGAAVLSRPASVPQPVVYIDMEMTPSDLKERLGAMGYSALSDLSKLHYLQMQPLLPLDTEAGGAILVDACVRLGACLCVIDTMARVVRGDENDADTYRNFYKYTGHPLKAAGVTVLRLDHQGKDSIREQRGSSAKADDVDVVWHLTVTSASEVKLARIRSRIAWVPDHIDMVRSEEPVFSHQVSALGSWPAGTAGCAEALERLEMPFDATVRQARIVLRQNGVTASQAVLAAALRFRRVTPVTAADPDY